MKSLPLLLLASLLAWLSAGNRATAQRAASGFTGVDRSFIENRGQWNSDARFLLRAGNLDLWIGAGTVAYDLYNVAAVSPRRMPTVLDEANEILNAAPRSHTRIGHVVRVRFEGAVGRCEAHGVDRGEDRYSFLAGSDTRRWVADAAGYRGVQVDDLYDGIDARYYLDRGMPRYDLLVRPGADPSKVRMRYEGADGVRLRRGNRLAIITSQGVIEQRDLYAYQIIDGRRRRVTSRFTIAADGSVRFKVGAYDRRQMLVIDPIIFSTYVGDYGANNTWDEESRNIALDSDRNIYIATDGDSLFYPTTAGAYRREGWYGVYITKMNATGSALEYSTYLGVGMPYGIAIDREGSVYVTGRTYSDSLRGIARTRGAFDTTFGGASDAFVTKLNASGNDLVYSTLLGGEGNDGESGLAIAVDSSGNAYVAGTTFSADFPVTPGAFGSSEQEKGSAFICKLNRSGSELLYAARLTGTRRTFSGRGIAVDRDGRVVAIGITVASNFPVTSDAPQKTLRGGDYDAFIAKLDPDGREVVYGTYLGGSRYDEFTRVVLDPAGNIYVTGRTESMEYPTTQGAFDRTFNVGSNPTTFDYDVVVTKISAADGSLVYSTFLGGTGDEGGDYGYAIAADDEGNAYVAGQTNSYDFPTTANALDQTYNGDSIMTHADDDAFLAKFGPAGELLYSSYLGGWSYDLFTAMVIDDERNVYITGKTWSEDYPLTPGAYSTSSNFLIKFFLTKLAIDPPVTAVPESGDDAARDLVVAPNPATDHIAIDFTLARGSRIGIELYTIDGVLAATPKEPAFYSPGRHAAWIDLAGIPNGVYLLRLRGAGRGVEKRVTIVR